MVTVKLGRQQAEDLADYLRNNAAHILFHDQSGAALADWIEECCGMRKEASEREAED